MKLVLLLFNVVENSFAFFIVVIFSREISTKIPHTYAYYITFLTLQFPLYLTWTICKKI